MSDAMITAENISKAYQIGVREPGDEGLGRAIKSVLSAPVRRFQRLSGKMSEKETFWALRDVSFEVRRGEVLGVIGRNGAGKSTLLKVLSRITEPTTGTARIKGRIASLLEVGTGFHPELTGHENIFLNGAILGMGRREIQSKYDQIVEFAEISRFLDTPVKRYSSGMYVRLAFAVAAFLEPEVLIVDEVLAVGDAQFQKKCLGRMQEVAQGHGRTVLFVSHNMAMVRQLCGRCVFLNKGRLEADGDPAAVIDRYLDAATQASSDVYEVAGLPRRWNHGTGHAEILRIEVPGDGPRVMETTRDLAFDCTVRANQPCDGFRIGVVIYRLDGGGVGSLFGPDVLTLEAGETGRFRVTLDELNLAPGKYVCEVLAGRGTPIEGRTEFDVVDDVLHFEILPKKGSAGLPEFWEPVWGAVRLPAPTLQRVG